MSNCKYTVLNLVNKSEYQMSESEALNNNDDICICYLRQSTTTQKSLDEQKSMICDYMN